MDRAADFGSAGWGFESLQARQFKPLKVDKTKYKDKFKEILCEFKHRNCSRLLKKPVKEDKAMEKDLWVEKLEKIYRSAPIRETLNSDIWYDNEYRAHFKLVYKPDFCHGLGDIHGGIISALIDNATWFTVAASYPNRWLATTELHTYMLKPAKRSNLYSEGFIVSKGVKLAVARAEVKNEEGTVIAFGSATIYISNIEFDEEKSRKIIEKIKLQFKT